MVQRLDQEGRLTGVRHVARGASLALRKQSRRTFAALLAWAGCLVEVAARVDFETLQPFPGG